MGKKKKPDPSNAAFMLTAEGQAMMDLKFGDRERGLKPVGFVTSNSNGFPLSKRKQN